MQFEPGKKLMPFIRHYLLLDAHEAVGITYRLFSDGQPGIVVPLTKNMQISTSNYPFGQQLPSMFIYGQMSVYRDLKIQGQMALLVVVLRPFALHLLFGIPADALNDGIFLPTDLFGADVIPFERKMAKSKSLQEVINTIESFLFERFQKSSGLNHDLLLSLELINRHQGLISMENLLKEVHVSERQLERHYRRQIGVSPKKFMNVIRFQHFLKIFRDLSPAHKLTAAVYQAGYYDQAHLQNYFKAITGITPMDYQLKVNKLAINFMQF
ncbi:AraC-like DNA-binding protein [Pedobacter sp. AK013]|uniref:AraC family transcriptional regulator n=1 Tax=Pedobacter sp. AK013 TaxID=2723071 RepID=UPI0016197CF5|nr:helix-turn-helix domain-containing protein [Pedobacter sp. AK013]MBB6237525.1 AraC-like DNA-binding protein [Pedobacter sp. AK013]